MTCKGYQHSSPEVIFSIINFKCSGFIFRVTPLQDVFQIIQGNLLNIVDGTGQTACPKLFPDLVNLTSEISC